MTYLKRLAGNCVILTALSVLSVSTSAEDLTYLWNFDADQPGSLPKDFVVGTLFDGRPAGEWKVLQTDRAKSPTQVLGQLMGKGAEHAYKVVLIKASTSSDLDLEVSVLPVDGKADMGGGLIWHAADDRNYYLTRANPLEQNIRIYRVVKGVRQMLQNFDQIIDVRSWHTLHVVMRGCRVNVLFDEKQVFELCDETFKEGLIGLWTKSDAVTYFDNLKFRR
ncbi:MAG TPA: hypothetical protein VKB81_15040 [Nitrospira sp.]|nr:hypothetical protein [Nitrospira sp.]